MAPDAVPRRAFLGALSGGLVLAAAPRALGQVAGPPRDLTVLDLHVEGSPRLANRFTLFVPNHLAPGERVPLLILLHGLGEVGDPRTGAWAWHERYGLGAAYARLRRAPLARTSTRGELTDARLAELNASLATRPFRGLAIACPVTPKIADAASLEAYADWLTQVVVPRARKEAPVFPGAAHTAIDGCSMGGPIAFEVAIRRPQAFGACGGVQSAFGLPRAEVFASRLAAAVPSFARLGPAAGAAIHVETSALDPFHDANLALARSLTTKGIPNDLLDLPGPHDQPWLREAGTLEMLLWHDRRPR